MVLSAFRSGTQSGKRAGLRILIGPAGGLALTVTTQDESDDDTEASTPTSISSLEAHAAATRAAPTHSGVTVVACPACGVEQEAFDDIPGFRCSACHQDSWKIRCRRCKQASTIFGSATGTGALQFRRRAG